MFGNPAHKWFAAIAAWMLSAAAAQAAVFEIIALPDTENYVNVPNPQAPYPGFPGIMEAQTQWIVDNRVSENIVFVTQLGDLIHHYPTAEMPEARRMMDKLDQPGQQVPYSVCAGNHELETAQSRTLVAQNFGPSRYAGYDWYKGSYNNFNHYQVFSAGGYDFLHINLQKDPDANVLLWAQGVINANLGEPTIISTHDYLIDNTTRSTAGTDIWNGLVKNNPQVFMTLNGHTHVPAGAARMVSNNSGNKAVLQMLSDFEDYTTQPSGDTNTGYLRKIIFDTDNKKISVQTYSPTYAAVPWLTDGDHQFSYDVAFLPQVPGTALSPIFVTSAATCTTAGYSQNFGGVPGPTGTALPLGWTVWQIAGSGTTFSNAKAIQPADIAGATSANQTLLLGSAPPGATWGSQAANAANGSGRALATNPGNNGAGVIQLGITNGMGAPVTSVHLNYDLQMLWSNPNDDGSELPGYALFWSKTGSTSAADWIKLGEDSAAGTKTRDITLPTPLAPGADLYLRWADDNVLGLGGESVAENVWSINNVQVTMTAIANHADWAATGTGSWGQASNWNESRMPLYLGDTATFADSVSGTPAIITLDGDRVISGLTFNNTLGHSYTISPGSLVPYSTLTLDGTGTSVPVVVLAGTHTIAAPVVLGKSVTISTAADSGLIISGQISQSGDSLALTKDGPGTLVLSGGTTYTGSTTVQGGTLKYDLSGGKPVTIGSDAVLTIAEGATVELAGTQSGTSDGLHHLHVLNNSHAEGLKVSGTGQSVGGIDGEGSTIVLAGADLTATYINQDTLTILGTPSSPGTVTLRPITAPAEFAGQAGASQVPEPGTVTLLALGSLCLLVFGWCRRER